MPQGGSAGKAIEDDITVRPADPSDAAIIAELLTVLGYPVSAAEAEGRLRWLQGVSGAEVLVAEAHGEVAAVASYQIIELLERPQPQCRITALVTHRGQRRRGAARALIRVIESAARERDCFRLEVTSRPERAEALRFYTMLGFHERPRRLVKALPSG